MTTPDVVEVTGDWLKSWWSWPRSWVDEDLRDEAVAWFLGVLVCKCSREALSLLTLEQRRGLVSSFAAVMRDGVSRSFLQPDGRRAFVLVQVCNHDGVCRERSLVRVVLKWA